MIMFGNAMNAAAILFGGILGVLLGSRVSERFERHILQAVALGIFVLGLDGALEMRSPLVMLISLALGALIGEWLGIESALERFTEAIKNKLRIKSEGFATGFVSATLLFCVGSMAIMGALNSGLHGDHDVLLAKALIDGIISVLMASTLGMGIGFSAISVFLYQGAIVLMASQLAPFLSETLISDISSVGSVLIMAIGIRMLGILEIKVGNLLPAILVAAVLSSFGM